MFYLGKMIHSMVAHLDAVTSLAVDPNGIYLMSGSKSAYPSQKGVFPTAPRLCHAHGPHPLCDEGPERMQAAAAVTRKGGRGSSSSKLGAGRLG